MGGHLLIVTGYPGAGKSHLAALILREFPGFRLMSYDAMKEARWDREGFDDEAEKKALNDRCLEAFWDELDKAMALGGDIMIEYPFCRKHVAALRRLIDKNGCHPITIVLAGDVRVLFERFEHRDASASERHPGHLSSAYHKGGRRVPMARPTFEQYERECREKDYFINLGPTLTLDMTDFSTFDESAVIGFVRGALEAAVQDA